MGRELKIAFEELAAIHRKGGSKRYEHYVQSCAEQYWTLFARNSDQAQKPVGSNAAEEAGLHSHGFRGSSVNMQETRKSDAALGAATKRVRRETGMQPK